jgi:putative glutamine amidotransferase
MIGLGRRPVPRRLFPPQARRAEDGTIEAIRIADAPTFALGVQWHAEYEAQRNWINRALFQAFGAALSAHRRAA